MFRAVCLVLLGVVASGLPVQAAVLTVTKTADTLDGACDRDCSLREAVVAANALPGADAIVVPAGVYVLTRPGKEDASAGGDLDVQEDLAILGAGARATILDGGGIDRVLHGVIGDVLEVHGVTIRNGRALGTGGDGGGILGNRVVLTACHVTGNQASRQGGGAFAFNLEASDTTFSDNEASAGGAIASSDVLRLTNVTISGNRAEIGGGLYIETGDQVLTQVTITGNRAVSGGGFYHELFFCPSGVGFCILGFAITRSIVAGNVATGTPPSHPDCRAYTDSVPGSFNVFGVDNLDCNPGSTDRAGTLAAPLDPRLAPLGDHGGPTPTHLPLPDSPALDRIPSGCTAADQRGRPRPAGSGCDSGAVERALGCQPGADILCLGAGERFQVQVRWSAQGQTGAAGAVPLTADTGSFWFFDADNIELTLKVLDGCNLNGRFWVFLTGSTDVGVEVEVKDTVTGRTWTHTHTAGTPLQPRLDTNALEVCP
jgi:CSLREA domain-containing protein